MAQQQQVLTPQQKHQNVLNVIQYHIDRSIALSPEFIEDMKQASKYGKFYLKQVLEKEPNKRFLYHFHFLEGCEYFFETATLAEKTNYLQNQQRLRDIFELLRTAQNYSIIMKDDDYFEEHCKAAKMNREDHQK